MIPRVVILFIIISNFVINTDILKSASGVVFPSSQTWNFVNFNGSYNLYDWNQSILFKYQGTHNELDNNQQNLITDQDDVNFIDDLDIQYKDEVKNVNNYLNNYIFGKLPPFDVTVSTDINLKCRQDGAEYLKQLSNLQLWAINMYDSSAKIPSGILSGNINQLGDFDQCLNTHSEKYNIHGQYCLAYLQLESPKSYTLKKFYNMLYSYFPFKSDIDDVGHRVPRFSSINWALCVPSSCTNTDVEIALKTSLSSLKRKTGLQFKVRVEKHMCQTNEYTFSTSNKLGGLFFVSFILFVISTTIYDSIHPNQNMNMFLAFSLKRNIKILFSLKRPDDDIASVHGIRFLNAVMLLIAHKSMAVFYTPFVNRTPMSEIIGQPWTVLGRAASLYTDPFIMFSGMLTAYSYFGRLNRGKKVNILEEYISRLLRIIPPLAALILFCTLIAPLMGSGPQWNLVVTHHSDLCKSYWWRNILFIHNYFGFENMCLTHTHHVGIDTQLFLIAPIFIFILWKWRKQGVAFLLLLATISTILRYQVTYTMGLSNYIHFGTSIKQLFSTANNMYILPVHRATVYIIGILLGYLLRNMKNMKIKPVYLNIGHAVALALFSAAFFGPSFMGKLTYIYQPIDAAWYAAFAPIAWCLSFAWIIVTDYLGYYNVVNRYFSWRGYLVCTRLSYAIYLTQFPVYFYNVGRARSADYYNFFSVMLNLQEYFCIFVLSMVLTLLFDTPFQNIKKLLFKRELKPIENESNRINNDDKHLYKKVKAF